MEGQKRMAEQALEQGGGILRLTPTWVPRSFCRPGKRIKLHPNDSGSEGRNRRKMVFVYNMG